MKILLINGSLAGSTGAIIQSIASGAINQGHSVTLVIPRKDATLNDERIKIVELRPKKLKSKCLNLTTKLLGNNGFCNTRTTVQMLSNIERPDIIHVHSVHSYFIDIGAVFKYAKDKAVPIIWTMHDLWLLTGRCANAQKGTCPKYTQGCVSCPDKHLYPRAFLFDFAHKFWEKKRSMINASRNITLVCPSAWLASIAKAELPNAEITVIRNGIDTKCFSPRINDSKTNAIGSAAAIWSIEKGGLTLAPIAQALSKRGIRLIVAGAQGTDFDSDLYEALPTIKSRQEMAAFYRNIDVFFNPTLIDNFPTVNIESLSCGTPVVCTKVGGACESIISGTNGFEIETSDGVDEIVEKILRAQKLSRKTVFETSYPYSEDNMVAEYLSLYKIRSNIK